MGFIRCAPLCRYSRRASTPRSKLPSVQRYHPPNHVPPPRFLTAMTACSARRATGLLHPATDLGFAAFHAAQHLHPLLPRDSRTRDTRTALPATRFTPFEDFPSSTAVPHHCGRCLLAVTVAIHLRHRPRPAPPVHPQRRSAVGLSAMRTLRRARSPRGDRDAMSEPVMLRSAEADPHVTTRTFLAPAEAAAHPARPRTTRNGAEAPPRPGRRTSRETGRSPKTRPTPAQHPKMPPELHRRRSASTIEPGCHPAAEAMGSESSETSHRAANFKALLRRRVRCAVPPLPATRHSFLPWALFPFEVSHSSLRPDDAYVRGVPPSGCPKLPSSFPTRQATPVPKIPRSLRRFPYRTAAEAMMPKLAGGPKPSHARHAFSAPRS